MAESAEQLSQHRDVREALEQATGRKTRAPEKGDRFWFVSYLLFLIACAALYYLVGSRFIPLTKDQLELTRRLLRGAGIIIILLAISSAISLYSIARVSDPSTRFTLKRIKRLLVFLLVLLVTVSVIFVNWYTALISVGVVSVIVGLSVQTPMTSFIGWIYILVRRPYRVGDRIKIDDATGDVIDVGYIDTTLWEFGGQYISGDHPSGRIIKFPNSKVLNSMVFNYSWPLFPYIWNEIKFNVGYESDLEFIARTMQRLVEEELGEAMLERVQQYRELLARTPVDELEVREHPRVVFRVSENTWLEAIVRYLVAPREAGPVKTRLIKKLLPALNAAPDKVLFPKGPNR
ncbi:MAG TPA: mechanosensitive ion channel family protein [Chthoniobacterales bacterium]|nr:mechanosensitive ion channel family protein [Chthoniobacterales bacterium]